MIIKGGGGAVRTPSSMWLPRVTSQPPQLVFSFVHNVSHRNKSFAEPGHHNMTVWRISPAFTQRCNRPGNIFTQLGRLNLE